MEMQFPVILDGATGTELQKRGFTGDMSAEQWVLEHPESILEIQRKYVASGSNVLYAPTFGGNRQKLEERGIFNRTEEMNKALAQLSKQAADGKAWVAGDIAPTGRFLAPLGDASFEELVDIYTEQAAGLEQAGVDLYVIETMMTLTDARAAVLAIRSMSKKPILVSFTCDESGKILSGTDVVAALSVMEGMGVSAFGLNCSAGPEQMLLQLQRLHKYARVPLIAKPNAGMPEIVNGEAVYNCPPEEFVALVPEMLKAGVALFGGCCGTSNVLTGQLFNIPILGTHAHSWVMSFPTELDAFRAYADIFPGNCLLLVDTYDTLRSGVPNAITVFNELRSRGYEPAGIRLDSGDLAYLTKKARKMLDEAGFENAKICVSGDLDETLINSLKMQGACINTWGVGTKLITSDDKPALGGVYKMSAEIIDGVVYPKIKLSENAVKITNPGIKTVYRLYDKDHMAIADLIALRDEKFDTTKPLTIYHPEQTYKRMTLTDYTMRELLVPIFIDGKQVYNCPTIQQIQAYAKQELDTLWEESKRLMNPQVYKVDYSDGLYDLRQKLIREHRKLPANA